MVSSTRSATQERAAEPLGRRARRRAELRAKLVVAVEELLTDGGTFTELSVEQLLRQADLARTTFYAYFEDKGDALVAIGDTVIDEFVASMETWWALGPGDGPEDLARAMRVFLDAYLPHRVVLAAIVEAAPFDPRVRDLFEERLGLLTDRIAEHLEAGRASGFVRAGVDPEPAARWVAWMLERGCYAVVHDAGDLERQTAALTRLLWNALYAEAA